MATIYRQIQVVKKKTRWIPAMAAPPPVTPPSIAVLIRKPIPDETAVAVEEDKRRWTPRLQSTTVFKRREYEVLTEVVEETKPRFIPPSPQGFPFKKRESDEQQPTVESDSRRWQPFFKPNFFGHFFKKKESLEETTHTVEESRTRWHPFFVRPTPLHVLKRREDHTICHTLPIPDDEEKRFLKHPSVIVILVEDTLSFTQMVNGSEGYTFKRRTEEVESPTVELDTRRWKPFFTSTIPTSSGSMAWLFNKKRKVREDDEIPPVIPEEEKKRRAPLPLRNTHVLFCWNGFGIVQTVKKSKAFHFTVAQTYMPKSGWFEPKETVADSITYHQTATGRKVNHRSVSNTFHLAQSMIRTGTRHFSLSNHLTFPTNRTIYVPVAGFGDTVVPNLLYSKVVGSNPQTGPPLINTAQGFFAGHNKARSYPYFTLQVPGRAITLPAPEFNDSQGASSKFNIRRSMYGNIAYTYIHSLNTYKLKYDFVIGIPKMFELEYYLLNFNSAVHVLTNWKGEIWYVFITNNPMEFVTKSRYSNSRGNANDDREKVMITLEFEGTRIH